MDAKTDAPLHPQLERKPSWLRAKWEARTKFEKISLASLGAALLVLVVVLLTIDWSSSSNSTATRVGLDREQVNPAQLGMAVKDAIDPRLNELSAARERLAEEMKKNFGEVDKRFGDVDKRLIVIETKPGWTAADYQLLTDTIAGKK